MFDHLFDLTKAIKVSFVVVIVFSEVIKPQKVAQSFVILTKNQTQDQLKLLNWVAWIERDQLDGLQILVSSAQEANIEVPDPLL